MREWEWEEREHKNIHLKFGNVLIILMLPLTVMMVSMCTLLLLLLLLLVCFCVCALLFSELNSPCKKHKSVFSLWRLNLSVFLSAWMNEPFSDDRWMLYNNLMNCHELHLACCCYCYAAVVFSLKRYVLSSINVCPTVERKNEKKITKHN